MKNWIRRMGVVTLFTLSTFTFTSVTGPTQAQAAIGSIAWPLFPLMIVGAALEVTGVATGVAAAVDGASGYRYRSGELWGSALAQIFLGIIFLDEQNQTGNFQKISSEQASLYGLSKQEQSAYNSAVENGDLEQIFQQAALELNQDSSKDEAKTVMQNLLGQLPDDAHRGFSKIAQYLVVHRMK